MAYCLGANYADPQKLKDNLNKEFINRIKAVLLASSVDWSSNVPPVGNQGQQGSCVAWSSGYAYKSYEEQVDRNWGNSTINHQFSPAFIYNQINGGADNGAEIPDALNLMINKGCATLDIMPYSDSDCTTKPNATQLTEAANYKDKSWTSLFSQGDGNNIVNVLKSALSVGLCIVATPVYWEAGWQQSGDIAESLVKDNSAGGHAICLVGYDDNHVNTGSKDPNGAFKFINSWGTDWGHSGYGWISYKYATQEFVEGETMVSDPPAPTPPTPSPSVFSVAIVPSTSTVTTQSTVQLAATATLTDESKIDVTKLVTWESANQDIAVVNSSGLVAAKSVGSVNVLAIDGKVSGTANVTVTAPTPPTPTKTTTIQFTIGSCNALVNGVFEQIDSSDATVMPILTPQGRTYLPTRFLANVLGGSATWDATKKQVTLTIPTL